MNKTKNIYEYETNHHNHDGSIDYDNSTRTDAHRASEGIGCMCLPDGTRRPEEIGTCRATGFGQRRDELFLTTKVWISNAGEEKAAQSIDESLRKLQTDYIDLLLIHQAYGDVFGSWRAMEKAYKAGKVRAIGVSNFQSARFFDFAHYVDVKPMINQLQCNALIQQHGIEPLLNEFDTRMMAWGPLGGQGVEGVVKSETLAEIGNRYGKSAAQVALRWLTQRGIIAIPKSGHKERMEQNFNIFDFTLTHEEMEQIATLNQHDTGTINFSDVQFVKYLIETYG